MIRSVLVRVLWITPTSAYGPRVQITLTFTHHALWSVRKSMDSALLEGVRVIFSEIQARTVRRGVCNRPDGAVPTHVWTLLRRVVHQNVLSLTASVLCMSAHVWTKVFKQIQQERVEESVC